MDSNIVNIGMKAFLRTNQSVTDPKEATETRQPNRIAPGFLCYKN